jgi:pilus assembly protein CpaE
VLLEAMRAGTREFLNMPFRAEALEEALGGVGRMLRDSPLAYSSTEHIYSILPSKPGVGATTLAMNLSAAVARRRDSRVLLADLDLSCGMIRFLLKLPAGSIMDAFLRSAEMDVELWRQTVFRRDGVEILHSGGLDPHARLDPHQVQCLIDFARKDYNFMCFDMSGNLEQYSMQVMSESKEVFIVCTPEMASLQLAREKVACLATAGLRERASILLTRHDLNGQGQDPAAQAKRASDIAGIPVRAVFGDCTKQVENATMLATWVDRGSRFGKDLDAFTRQLMGDPGPPLAALPQSLPAVLPDIEEGAQRVVWAS